MSYSGKESRPVRLTSLQPILTKRIKLADMVEREGLQGAKHHHNRVSWTLIELRNYPRPITLITHKVNVIGVKVGVTKSFTQIHLLAEFGFGLQQTH